MLTSVPYPREPVRAPDDDPYTARLRGLSYQQLTDAMTFLAFWSPAAFTAVLDYCEATEWGWNGFDPDLVPDPDDDDDPDGGPAPVCGRCGGDLGIFLKFGLDWRHYRGQGLDDIELYEPGHAPELAWRAAATPPAPGSPACTAA
jgi:hypothetical protein